MEQVQDMPWTNTLSLMGTCELFPILVTYVYVHYLLWRTPATPGTSKHVLIIGVAEELALLWNLKDWPEYWGGQISGVLIRLGVHCISEDTMHVPCYRRVDTWSPRSKPRRVQ